MATLPDALELPFVELPLLEEVVPLPDEGDPELLPVLPLDVSPPELFSLPKDDEPPEVVELPEVELLPPESLPPLDNVELPELELPPPELPPLPEGIEPEPLAVFPLPEDDALPLAVGVNPPELPPSGGADVGLLGVGVEGGGGGAG